MERGEAFLSPLAVALLSGDNYIGRGMRAFYVSLSMAAICQECGAIFAIDDKCPACASGKVWPLTRWIASQVEASGDAEP